MKTRQEMVYDFMVALCANSEVLKDWSECSFELGSYGEHVHALAEEMADKILERMV